MCVFVQLEFTRWCITYSALGNTDCVVYVCVHAGVFYVRHACSSQQPTAAAEDMSKPTITTLDKNNNHGIINT